MGDDRVPLVKVQRKMARLVAALCLAALGACLPVLSRAQPGSVRVEPDGATLPLDSPPPPFAIIVGSLVFDVPGEGWADVQRFGHVQLSPQEHRLEMSALMEALGACTGHQCW